MARKIFKKWFSHPRMREHRTLQLFGAPALKENLWHLNRRSVARAFSIGLFCAFLPIPGQMVVAAGLAILFASNLPIALLMVWTTNPLTIPFIFVSCYLVGAWILDMPMEEAHLQFEWSWAWFSEELTHIGIPLLTGSIICGALAAAVGYVSVRLYWRWYVTRVWRTRHKRKVDKIIHDILD